MRNGPEDVKSHIWFENYDWEDVAACRLPVPHVPRVLYPGDPSNFEEYNREPAVRPDEELDEQMVHEQFGDFCFTSSELAHVMRSP